ncbi:cardiolipin synthase [Halioglobus japonicus]|uniref:Cardiolipin synthase n=1 Tax=Halioglobus japonicus TaxID=930805 RepID=A0AAP8SP07_9GAMM|nr:MULTISPECIES: cardiolipin synthase [Halioglobus]AQA19734.1 cardiolipin synthase [Halioglobus japonicus]KZX59454.1 cardiolipin synthase [Halioglobus sp. HI00S01]PLW87195.1 cardiolipin synthase [Halioglobus japonicus]GHD09721.1 cardiolipin synthase A [Halioglobus japonicus]
MDAAWVNTAIAVGVALFYVAALVSAIEAILQSRTPQGAIAWAISLLSFPFITVPLYLIFGRSRFAGYQEKRDRMERESLELIQRTSGNVQEFVLPVTGRDPLYTSLFNLARMPATRGNQVDLLIDGNATFDDISRGLEQAQDYILFQFYIIRDDELGRRLGRILADKARAGVEVFLTYDEIGSRQFQRSRLCKQLHMSGVRVAPFNTTQGRRNRFQLNFRNHRKVVVVDGKQAWIGGHNVGIEYLGLSKRFGHWRDTHVRFQGPAVIGAEQAFATDWLWATGEDLEISWDFNSSAEGSSTVLVFPSDPASEYEEAGLMFHQAIVAAQHRIWIASPYFVPDRGIISALQLAALRGVDVRVLIPDEPDGPMVAMANWSFTRELLAAGVKIYRYQGGFMHQKVLLMDDQLAGVGTANFDNRSFRLNFEITVLVNDVFFARKVEDMLNTDLGRSREVSLDEFDNKPAWFTVAMATARLFAPVL